MKRSTISILDEYNNILTGYVTLYSYRLVNLCIKADPMSLLGVVVSIEDIPMNIDDVAIVAAGDNAFELKVVPKDEDNLLLIGKGIAEEHPEFTQEIDSVTIDDVEYRFIKLIMPSVNEDRKKLLMDSVKVLHDECVAKMKASTTLYSGRITLDMMGAAKEEIDNVNTKMQETTDMYNKICEESTATKNKEIEEAYSLYLQNQQAEQAGKSEQAEAEGKDVVSKLKIQ